MGRSGSGRLHRRAAGRRHARSQWAAAGTLYRYRRRPGDHGVRSRCSAGRRGLNRAQMATATRQDAADRHGRGRHHLGRPDQARSGQPQSLRQMARAHADRARGRQGGYPTALGGILRVAARPPAGVRLFAGRPEDPDGADGDHRPRSSGFDGHGYADLGALRQVETALHLFQAEFRPGHQPADRPDPRGISDEPRLLHRPAAQPVRPRGTGGATALGSTATDPDK